MQAAVIGRATDVDLPLTIRASNYYSNSLRRAARGDMSGRVLARLDDYLEAHGQTVWENSWVRFPREYLSAFAEQIFEHDLQSNKSVPGSPPRSDRGDFLFEQAGETWIRVPISYLVKLALADSVDPAELVTPADELPELDPAENPASRILRQTADEVLPKFLNDNTSPETISFHVTRLDSKRSFGRALAAETAKRYLLTQVLLQYANEKFGLKRLGQEATVFFSPHPPVRQKMLNRLISDSFYRELFMSPCLSGWDQGEDKRKYMDLCHKVLSRSHINVIDKLREAGIVTHNLVILPSTSSTSLANNGMHLSMGSQMLTSWRSAQSGGTEAELEKELGDLTIKIFEHFMPLFVGTYSAAPYRLDFRDFHPESALGFLPHELDYTYLRMLWRRWRGKARNRVLGHKLSPFGPVLLDTFLSRLFRLRGDYVPDFRLIDYPAALLSTVKSPALDGQLGNEQRLLRDLDQNGVFDRRMSLYLPFKLREYEKHGFCGFEARYYSLFASLKHDLAEASNLQQLVTLLALHYAASGVFDHRHLPDDPVSESERRQTFFATALGIPTIYVRLNPQDRVLRRILENTQGCRPSRRYSGYLRIPRRQYLRGLLATLERDGREVVESLGMESTLANLRDRLDNPREASAAGQITQGILDQAHAKKPTALRAQDFNRASEDFCRTTLRDQHIREAIEFVRADFSGQIPATIRELLPSIGILDSVTAWIDERAERLTTGRLSARELKQWIHLLLLHEHWAKAELAGRSD